MKKKSPENSVQIKDDFFDFNQYNISEQLRLDEIQAQEKLKKEKQPELFFEESGIEDISIGDVSVIDEPLKKSDKKNLKKSKTEVIGYEGVKRQEKSPQRSGFKKDFCEDITVDALPRSLEEIELQIDRLKQRWSEFTYLIGQRLKFINDTRLLRRKAIWISEVMCR